ncbi:hypothetical protein C8J57DRAFT_1239556 [Mycena rebaudengoi]|nr:hypothetical protein C8J57DRAFT_1239556 [Mycena rebaudengoi]
MYSYYLYQFNFILRPSGRAANSSHAVLGTRRSESEQRLDVVAVHYQPVNPKLPFELVPLKDSSIPSKIDTLRSPVCFFQFAGYILATPKYISGNDNDDNGQKDIKEKAICLETDRNDRFPDELIDCPDPYSAFPIPLSDFDTTLSLSIVKHYQSTSVLRAKQDTIPLHGRYGTGGYSCIFLRNYSDIPVGKLPIFGGDSIVRNYMHAFSQVPAQTTPHTPSLFTLACHTSPTPNYIMPEKKQLKGDESREELSNDSDCGSGADTEMEFESEEDMEDLEA